MIERMKLEGFKSIKKMDLELRPINILIGGNGSGKSNLLEAFEMLRNIGNLNLGNYSARKGENDRLLHFGRKNTKRIVLDIGFVSDSDYRNSYSCVLEPKDSGALFIAEEAVSSENKNSKESPGGESIIFAKGRYFQLLDRHTFVYSYAMDIVKYHFHDTGVTSYLRKPSVLLEQPVLLADGSNLASFLYKMKTNNESIFSLLTRTVQSVAPYIKEFVFNIKNPDTSLSETTVELRWVHIKNIESSFSVLDLSDGTLRFIALATILMQPKTPKIIIIDEPELGLHPFAINKLVGLIKTKKDVQFFIATQHPSVVSAFNPEDVIILDMDKKEGYSLFKRLERESLKLWLEDYTLGDLWEMNVINGGQPI